MRSRGLLEGNSARYTPVVYIVYGIEALGKRFLKVLKALESRKIESVRCSQKPHFHWKRTLTHFSLLGFPLVEVRLSCLLAGKLARIAPEIYIVYSVEALDRKDRKVPEALESPSVESVRCGQKLHFRSH